MIEATLFRSVRRTPRDHSGLRRVFCDVWPYGMGASLSPSVQGEGSPIMPGTRSNSRARRSGIPSAAEFASLGWIEHGDEWLYFCMPAAHRGQRSVPCRPGRSSRGPGAYCLLPRCHADPGCFAGRDQGYAFDLDAGPGRYARRQAGCRDRRHVPVEGRPFPLGCFAPPRRTERQPQAFDGTG